jgi:Kef-type K+ transport system membrane component KefB/predicted transcriptional regulator
MFFSDGTAIMQALVGAEITASSPLNLVLLFGLIILAGTFGARLAQKFHIPQVVGCIVVGIVLGYIPGLVTAQTIESLQPFTMFALGLIGFMIGAELRAEVFRKYGRQFFVILFSQGLGAFALVTVGIAVLLWLVTGEVRSSLAVGILLGAIASATAPAATVNVLWEYKTKGPLTAAVLAVVALDDALALLLYRGAATGAKALYGLGDGSVVATVAILFAEILGAVVLGGLAGVMLFFLLKFVRADDKILEFAISCLLLVVGLSIIPGIDPILPAMTLGITIANLIPRQSKNTFKLVERFSPPIYTAFFVLAGAHMEFGTLSPLMVAMIAVYVIFRAVGKVVGAWAGAKQSSAPPAVQKYLGICLLPQAGVAIGLAILAGRQFADPFGHTIIMVVMTATFLMEILGPLLVKVGVRKAGEVGMNVTEEDLIKSYTVRDVMDAQPAAISQDMSLLDILDVFSATDTVYYPVVDKDERIIGVITIADIKEMFANRDVASWLLACDVTEPVYDKTTPQQPLEEVLEHMRRYNLEYIPVVVDQDGDRLLGVLDYRMVYRKVAAEVLHRRRISDEMAAAGG